MKLKYLPLSLENVNFSGGSVWNAGPNFVAVASEPRRTFEVAIVIEAAFVCLVNRKAWTPP